MNDMEERRIPQLYGNVVEGFFFLYSDKVQEPFPHILI
jgi:hypothetical protein